MKAAFRLCLWALLCASAKAQVQYFPIDPSSFEGPYSAALGGATVSHNGMHDAAFQNPAAVAFTQRYALSAAYHGAGNALAASVVDTQTGEIAGALYGLTRQLKTTASRQNRLSVGNFYHSEVLVGTSVFGVVTPGLALGLNAKALQIKGNFQKTSDPDDISNINGTPWNFDLGLKYLMGDSFSVALLYQNVLPETGKTFAVFVPRIQTGFAYRSAFNLTLLGQADYIVAKPAYANYTGFTSKRVKAFGYKGGVEIRTDGGFAFRGGYKWDPHWDDDAACAGLAYDPGATGLKGDADEEGWSMDFSFRYGVIRSWQDYMLGLSMYL